MEDFHNHSQGPGRDFRGQELPGPGLVPGPVPGPDLSLRALTGCVLCVLIASTLLGNALVCAAVVRFRHLRSKVTNAFVVSLAVSDLLVGVLVMPWRALSEVAGAWLFGRFCDTWVAFDIMCSTASILNLCLISLDRYWAIASPFRYERRMTRRLALLMIGVAWTLSVLISFIPVRLNWHRAQEEEEEGEEDEGCNASLNRTYAIASSLISFYIPVLIMVGTYTRIFRIAQTQIRRISSLERAAGPRAPRPGGRHRSSAHAHEESSLKTTFKRETKVLKTLSVIVGVFVFCWLPFFVLNCVVPFCGGAHAHAPPCVSDATFSIFVWFGWANSSLNPVIYAFNADFRRAFSSLLGCSRSTAVRPVDFSNELASYHHDTTAGGGGVRAAPAPAPALTPPAPAAVAEPQNPEAVSDQRNPLLPAIRRFDGEPEISLDMMPFNCSDPDGWVIPGQVQEA